MNRYIMRSAPYILANLKQQQLTTTCWKLLSIKCVALFGLIFLHGLNEFKIEYHDCHQTRIILYTQTDPITNAKAHSLYLSEQIESYGEKRGGGGN